MTEDADSRPIPRAVVTLNGAALGPNLIVVADDSGRFVFSGLPAGSFTVTASKPPYLTMSYGQTTPGRGSGTPISIRDGQQAPSITLKLPRGAVISGRIVDEAGGPVPHAPIFALQYRVVNGEHTMWSLGAQWPPTDSAGRYRLYGLPQGEYVVAAYPPGDYMFFPGGNQGPFMPSGGAGNDVRQVGAAELDWAFRQIRAADAGNTPSATPAPAPPPAGATTASVTSFYPGTPDPSAAVAVTIGRGEERSGVDFAIARQRTAGIEGRVVGPDGQPATNIRMEATGMNGGTLSWPSADGTFARASLLPGAYRISARSADASLWATREVTLNGEDVRNLVLTLGQSPAVSGRVAFDGTSLQPPADLSAVRVSLVAFPSPSGLLSGRASADGTFKIPGVAPGRYRLQVSVPAAPAADPGLRWTVKSAMVKGRDSAEAPFEVLANESVADIAITFTDRTTELSGTLRDSAGRPAAGYYVVVFSQDKGSWFQGSRRLPAPVRAATDGAFRFLALPPGAYYIAAVTDLDPLQLYDEAFLSELAAAAISVTLGDGEKKVQELVMK